MSDHTVSFKVDDELFNYLQKKHNKSAYLRELVKADMRDDSGNLVGLQMQIETLEQQAQSHAEKEEMFQQRAEELKEVLDQSKENTQRGLQEAKENLTGVDRDPTNPAIQRWAEKIGMSPEQLCEELDDNSSTVIQ